MAIAKLSTQQENKLISALDRLSADPQLEKDPTQALCKIAEDMDLPAGHTRLLVNAFNTAQAGRQRESSDDYEVKSADHPLIDVDQVMDRLYPAAVKTAAVIHHETAISEDYLFGPYWLDEPATPVVKAAVAQPQLQYNAEVRIKTAQQNCEQLERDMQLRRVDMLRLDEQIQLNLTKIAGYFNLPGRPAPADVAENATARWGAVAGMIVKAAVGEISPVSRRHIHPVAEDAAPYSHIVDTGRLLTTLRDKKAAFEKVASEHQELIDSDLTIYSQHERTKTAAGNTGLSLSQLLGLGVAKDVITRVGGGMSPEGIERQTQKQLSQLAPPEHEAQLRNIAQQAMLQDLLSNDPVLMQQNPYDLSHAFNSLSAIAPRAMSNPELARSMMRRRMEIGTLEPFELQSLASIDRSLQPGFTSAATPAVAASGPPQPPKM